jgi:protein tyrosine/serine phosphatase
VVELAEYRTHWIELQGAHNVRDVAGLSAGAHRVRPGVLLRSDHLDDLTPGDLDILRDNLGLRAVVDLRTAEEAPQPAAWIATLGIDRLHLPLIDLALTRRPGDAADQILRDPVQAYRSMLDEAAPGVAQIFNFLLADEHRPALIHCAAGKDRTGITIAVLLAAAGVDEPGIVADYVATGERLGRVRAALVKRDIYKHLEAQPASNAVRPRAIEGVLDALRLYDDGARGFLRAHGISNADIARWRDLILEPA